MTDLTQEELKKILHYDPSTGIFTWLTNRKSNLIGKEAGCINASGYHRIGINYMSHRSHRLAFLYMEGVFPPKHVDHINHITSDNRWENLRHITHIDNCKNQSAPKNNKSGVVGVVWHKASKKWAAQVKVNYKVVHLGLFNDFFDAVCCRKSADNKYGFHQTHGEFLCPQ